MPTKIKSETAFISFQEYSGDSLLMEFDYKIDSILQDLSSYSGCLSIRDSEDIEVINITSSTGLSLSGTSFNISVLLSAVATRTLGPGEFSYAIKLVSPSLFENTLICGDIELLPEKAQCP